MQLQYSLRSKLGAQLGTAGGHSSGAQLGDTARWHSVGSSHGPRELGIHRLATRGHVNFGRDPTTNMHTASGEPKSGNGTQRLAKRTSAISTPNSSEAERHVVDTEQPPRVNARPASICVFNKPDQGLAFSTSNVLLNMQAGSVREFSDEPTTRHLAEVSRRDIVKAVITKATKERQIGFEGMFARVDRGVDAVAPFLAQPTLSRNLQTVKTAVTDPDTKRGNVTTVHAFMQLGINASNEQRQKTTHLIQFPTAPGRQTRTLTVRSLDVAVNVMKDRERFTFDHASPGNVSK
jgi:hypothetical protein